jgi:uncharacterized protein (UPF0332 family)
MIPDEFLRTANRLALSRASGAADFRSSISRAYYAVYHLARQVLNDRMQFYCRAGGNEHQWVHRHYANCTNADAREAGRVIQNMHDARKNADYDLSDARVETEAAARLSLERAEQIKHLLAACTNDANLAAVKAEMTRYRKSANVQ